MKYRLVIYCLIGWLLLACQSKNEIEHSYDPVENIEALWQIIDTKYCYLDVKGIDWDSVHTVYLEKAAELKTAGKDGIALFDLCAAMLDLLEDGHVNLYSPFDVSANAAWYDSYPANFDSDLQRLYLKDYRIAGGLYYCIIDDGRIGYIYYSSFSNSFSAANIYYIFTAFKDCRGIVLDVRNNGGGDLTNAYKLASPFFSENRLVGYWQHKNGPAHDAFSELEELTADTALIGSKWFRPLVVLCNRRSYSATNSFVSMMRYADNCAIVGGISGGGGGMPLSYELPCGWTVRFSSVRMFDRDKHDIENGIVPHVLVNQESSDKDDLIEKAVDLINKAYKNSYDRSSEHTEIL